jgi:hypothetical protein
MGDWEKKTVHLTTWKIKIFDRSYVLEMEYKSTFNEPNRILPQVESFYYYFSTKGHHSVHELALFYILLLLLLFKCLYGRLECESKGIEMKEKVVTFWFSKERKIKFLPIHSY